MISYILLKADSHGKFSTLKPQTELVVSIPASYLGGPRFEFSMESNNNVYYYSYTQFFQANAVIVP
jgi:hypothetical protein